MFYKYFNYLYGSTAKSHKNVLSRSDLQVLYHKIKLLIQNICRNLTYFQITARPKVQFSSKFKNYISVLKEKLKPVQIGVDLNAKSLIKFSDPPSEFVYDNIVYYVGYLRNIQ